jgi:hypothetical protein
MMEIRFESENREPLSGGTKLIDEMQALRSIHHGIGDKLAVEGRQFPALRYSQRRAKDQSVRSARLRPARNASKQFLSQLMNQFRGDTRGVRIDAQQGHTVPGIPAGFGWAQRAPCQGGDDLTYAPAFRRRQFSCSGKYIVINR